MEMRNNKNSNKDYLGINNDININDLNEEVKNLISKTLPKRESLNILSEKIDEDKMDNEEKFIFDLILKNLNKVAKIWKTKKISENNKIKYEFRFDLPQCKLDLKNKDEILKIDLPEFNEKIERKKLSKIQLNDIKQKGKFTVKSKIYTLDYLWKISSCLFHGKEKRIRVFRKQWAFGIGFFFRLRRVYSIEKFKNSFYNCQNFRSNIWLGILHLLIFIINLIDLIFGSASYDLGGYGFNDSFNIEKKYIINKKLSLEDEFPESFLISKFIYMKKDKKIIKNIENINCIKKVSNNLEKKWENYFKKELDKLDDLEEDEYEKIKKKIYSKKFYFILKEFENIKEFKPKIHKAIYNKIKSIDILNKNLEEKLKETNKNSNELKEELENKYLYLKSINFWFKNLFNKKKKILEKELEKKYHKLLIEELNKQGLKENAKILIKRKNLNQILNDDNHLKKKIKKHLKYPARINNFYPPYYPPYKKAFRQQTKEKKIYYFIRNYKVSFKSKYLFWRIIWKFAALFYYSKLITLNFIRYGWLLEYGIRGFFDWEIYYRDYSINSSTGEVKNNICKTVSIIQRFYKVLRGIKKSRNFFEKRPDTGLFGKNVGRLLNYLECYFFRFIFLGIFWVVILHPICNIIFITFSIIIALTSFIWVICYIILASLFRYLIYDYQAVKYYNQKKDTVYNNWDLMKRPQKWFPIFFYLFNFILYGFIQIIYCLCLTIVYPLIAVLVFIFVIFRFILRFIYDFCTFYLILKPFAKVPTIDTNFSHKISGPGVSKNLFYSLKFEDCVQLIIAELEKEKMKHFKQEMNKLLEKDYLTLKNKYDMIVGKFNIKSGIICERKILHNINYYKNIVNLQYNERIKKLNFIKKKINFYKIKFSDEELENLKLTTIEILKKNLGNFLISSFIWENYEVKIGHYKRLSSIILKNVFQNFEGVFESIKKTEERIILKKEHGKKKKYNFIKQALEGEIFEEKFKATLKKVKNKSDDFYFRTSFITLDFIHSGFISHDLFIDFYNINHKSYFEDNILIKFTEEI